MYEFFAGGGMAQLGLGERWRCVFANDIDPHKAGAFRAAHPGAPFTLGDVWALTPEDLPGHAALAWASSPCQDVSLAGARAGLAGVRSGAFWGFWRLIEALARQGRAPRTLVLENVSGLLTANGGADFRAICQAFADAGYCFGALEMDAAHFTPQSRPRVFLVGAHQSVAGAARALAALAPTEPFHSAAIRKAAHGLEGALRESWRWWRLPQPPRRNAQLRDILDERPCGACWNSAAKTAALLDLIHPRSLARVAALRTQGGGHVGAGFRRIRVENGLKVQRFEVRFDGLAGCLRTPAGGSSQQTLLFIEGEETRSRLLSPREAARLMGLPEGYPLPAGQTRALHLLGDGVCAPVAGWLGEHLLAPAAGLASPQRERAG